MADDTPDQTAAAPAPTTAEVIDAWFYAEFSDSVISRDATLWNFVFEAKDRLKAKLP